MELYTISAFSMRSDAIIRAYSVPYLEKELLYIFVSLFLKVECDFPFYGRWQYDAYHSAGIPGGLFRLFFRI